MKKHPQFSARQVVYALTLAAAVAFLLLGSRAAMGDREIFGAAMERDFLRAKVLTVGKAQEEAGDHVDGQGNANTVTFIPFEAKIKSGAQKGETLACVQEINNMFALQSPPVKAGDAVLLDVMETEGGELSYLFFDYVRTSPLIFLAVLFAALVIAFGRRKGFNTVLSLVLTILAIFIVLVPAVLTGHNIYTWSLMICVFIVLTNLLLVQGASTKSLTAALGCVGGVAVSGLLMLLMDKPMHITGLLDEESVFLIQITPDHPINLKATVFSMILIGSVGALMDVTMSIASALQEIREKEPNLPARELMRSGFAIGKDMIGTMANTLVLAYIGGSMSVILLLIHYTTGLTQLLNREMIAVEILQSLAGSLSVVAVIPLTSFICSVFYRQRKAVVREAFFVEEEDRMGEEEHD
ncbi:MAG: YibE/F family protein [Oscillospiraceae bacterium]|jgi:uncharacterized membrane protein|nr:YibE/F family protein [Oscillospiraceae bacterium]